MNRIRHRCWVIASLALLCGSAHAWDWWPFGRKAPPPKLLETSQVVQDLYYGDVLFYFYQNDYFQALTRVDAALEQGRVAHHQIESRLLKGGL